MQKVKSGLFKEAGERFSLFVIVPGSAPKEMFIPFYDGYLLCMGKKERVFFMEQKMKELIDDLNTDLANEYAAVIQYTYYAATIKGIHYEMFKPFFEKEIPDETGHALYLSEKISIYGGTPTTTPAPVKQVTELKDMLIEARKAEQDTIQRYKNRIEQAEELGLKELAIKLEDIIVDETEHFERMERILQDARFQSEFAHQA